MRFRAATLATLALLAVPAPAAAVQRLAVLTPTAPWSPACADPAQRQDEKLQERCTLLDAVAEEARAGALGAVGPGGIAVMTRENTAQILTESGGSCTEGECEVETARLIGADYVVSGSVVRFEGTWLLSLKLHDVKTARLLRTSERVEGAAAIEVIRAARRAAEAMVRDGLGLGPAAAPAPGALEVPAGPWSAGVRLAWAFPLGPKLADGSGQGSLPIFGITAGRRVSPRVTVEGVAELYGIADMGTIAKRSFPGAELSAKVWGTWLLAGAQVALTPGGGLAVAAGVGGGVVNLRIQGSGTGGNDVVDENSFVLAYQAELRASRLVSGIDVGFTVGASGFYLAATPRDVTAPGTAETMAVKPGLVVLPRIGLLVRFGL